jgi:diguanylate cyclase (GGDEF)-like protein
MTPEDNRHAAGLLKNIAFFCGCSTALVAVVGLSIWDLGLPEYISLAKGYVPMGTTACVLFLLQGAVLAWHVASPSRARKWPSMLVASLTTVVGAITLFLTWNISIATTIDLPAYYISPLTSLLFIFSGTSLIFLIKGASSRRADLVSSVFAALVIATGLMVAISYIYSDPLLYASHVIPMAILTSSTFILIGCGLSAASGKDGLFVKYFLGDSIRAMLIRTFVPLEFIGVIGSDILQHQVIKLNSAIVSGMSVVLFTTLTVIVVMQTANIIGGIVDRANSERDRVAKELRRLALHDQLTGLPNRTLFFARLEHTLARAHRYGHTAAVLYADLDGFKSVNDEFGHNSGDMVLKEFARRLLTCIRETDTAARLGGDEFAVILDDITDENEVTHIAQRIEACCVRPFAAKGRSCRVKGVSIGISLYPADAQDVDSLLNMADQAMYSAKKSNAGCRFSKKAT